MKSIKHLIDNSNAAINEPKLESRVQHSFKVRPNNKFNDLIWRYNPQIRNHILTKGVLL